ncbi:xylose isomerase-like protein [Mycolicibacterium phlei]|uniref:Sugar phosphate isomerase n=1 Tax=Mycolicibacterium phlei DSM 43239 = CCUG 21000 TaxID=1226750 RepID=A0A5N5UPM4_MYCPH|nr:sugar phosphate isomerase/epimerase family protein [Mycolicibacterium phlei]VEG10487.1 xylose isomerase-like protein [Mycobacteroides chelonae]AMO62386.1 Xylose isomerase-like TIM barrel [Mycolicibacterium phlei]KAB7751057.1 sugar phosphate isomerase [Mycolicibacterium phlei DSM 43239 = CCUG 21000]KXW61689.1 sugar phosphate isomerase [Mycolicibacterium phlei DSM 43239 = CCUG 21000]KXW71204.1 sugar phosphate isomerase [Mycolicibacterium phlei DSM 43072]
MYTAQTWPIAANMLGFGNRAPDGGHIKDAPAKVWASQLRQVRELGFDHIDPTDAWVPLAALSDRRIEEFRTVLQDEGLAISSISMTRNSVVDVQNGEKNLADAHRLIDLAPSFGATIVNTGFMQALTPEQEEQVWFWLVQGHVDDPALRDLAIERVRELGDHARANGIQISLEMYEDTYIGTPDDAVDFITDVDHDAVGLNPDLGNLIRLHRPMPHYSEMYAKVLPYSNFWHIKNYSRDFDPATGAYSSAPLPLKYGYINYRQMIRLALELGYSGPFCCEHYGSDSLGVCAENRDYIRQVLTSALA